MIRDPLHSETARRLRVWLFPAAADERGLLGFSCLPCCSGLGSPESPLAPGGMVGRDRTCGVRTQRHWVLQPKPVRDPLTSQTSAAAQETVRADVPPAGAKPLASRTSRGGGFPVWKLRRPPGARLEAAADCPIFRGLRQPRNPALGAVNLQLQLLSNLTAETSRGRIRTDKVCNLQPLPHGLQRVSEKAGTARAPFISFP